MRKATPQPKLVGPWTVYLNVDGRMKETFSKLTKAEAAKAIRLLDGKYALSAYPGTIRILVFNLSELCQVVTVKERRK